MIINGIKIIGLKAAAGESKSCDYYGLHLDLGYDLSDGRLYTSEYHNCNSWSEWQYPIIAAGRLTGPCTMQEIALIVARKVEEYKISRQNLAAMDAWGEQAAEEYEKSKRRSSPHMSKNRPKPRARKRPMVWR